MQIVGLNTELEVAIAHHTTQYKISPCSELNMEQLQIIIKRSVASATYSSVSMRRAY